jgi:ATP-dependent Zn protease
MSKSAALTSRAPSLRRCSRKRRFSDTRSPMARYAVAYHEAGHAVVGVLLRWVIRYVSIIPDEQTLGRVYHPRRSKLDYWLAEEVKSPNASARSHRKQVGLRLGELTAAQIRMRHRRARIDIAVRLAGRKAEKRFTREWTDPNVGSDRSEVIELALQLASEFPITADRIIVRESARATRLLAENWPCVEAVARALLVRNCLTGREVRVIVNAAKRSRLSPR